MSGELGVSPVGGAYMASSAPTGTQSNRDQIDHATSPSHDAEKKAGHTILPSHLKADSASDTSAGTRVAGHTAVDVDNEKADNSDVEKPEADSQQQPGGVNVKESEGTFAALKRTLSRVSSMHKSDKLDLEDQDGGEQFDLEEFMRTTRTNLDSHAFKHKKLSVTWQDLEVVGAGGIKLNVRTFPDAVKEFILAPVIMILMKMPSFLPKPKTILHKFDGAAKAGEMVLVLGRPGSGCSTFLKVIANERIGFLHVNGDVSYSGIQPKEIKKTYRGEVCYNQEDDLHQATLTVAQTLRFALKTKTPGKRLPEETKKSFRENVLDMLLKMYNITHTRDTLVGNAFVRGVSGGERKRVSIAEMMATRCCVASWDNSTRGLDASTALDYAKSLRVLTDVYQMTTFVSLYQAGEGIYEQFDKVLVIDEGRQVFYGPAKEARQYFIGLGYKDLPRQTTADYLTGCTDENERQFADGRHKDNVPSTPDALEEAYRASSIYAGVQKEREAMNEAFAKDVHDQEEFRAAVREDKRKFVPKKSPYTTGFWTQVGALTIRQFQLKLQDRIGLTVSYATAIIVAIITGTVYLNLPQTSAGAFTRGGVLFLALLFNSFQAFNELPTQMMGRPIMWKQTSTFALYRPGALTVASTLADVPFNALQIMLFGMIIYLMAGLARNAGAYFTYYALIYSGYLALSSFFRLLGCLCSSYDLAARLAATLVTAMVLYSGYIIPVYAMKRWLFWIYYMNPLNWGFSALMANEFHRVDLTCEGANIAPRSIAGIPETDKYGTGLGPNQVCTLQGSSPGSDVVPGSAYIAAAFNYSTGVEWRNFGFLIAYFVLFIALQALCMEKLKHGAGAPSITVFAKENKERKRLNEKLAEEKERYRKGEAEQDLTGLIKTRKPFTWENLTYDVPVSGGQKRLLNNIFGYVKPGTLTALMGASGAGKTTLLDVLANRKNIGVIRGDVLVNGRPIGKDFQRNTAYAEQMDTHEWTQTVREALRFSAYLRQPAHVSRQEKDDYVEQIIQLLEMEDIADGMIGFPGFGLSVEARKRVTIGVELASRPQLLLFLDEPTSGLDGQSAYNLVRFLRKLAAAGQAILCTIHQPNALLFENFDRLLLLKKGGRTIYFGDIGKDSHVIRSYFSKNGAECPPADNPAEFMLEAIGAGSSRKIGNKDWADIWDDSPEFAAVKEHIQQIKAEALATPDEKDPEAEREYATGFPTQLRTVSTRALISFWRNPDYGLTRLLNHMIVALLTGLTFLQVGNGVADLQYRVFAIFIATVMPALIISQVEPAFIMARDIFTRENSSRMYSPIVFALGQLAAETPYSILCAVGYFILFYYPIGFNYSSDRAGYQFFIILVTEFYSVTLGQLVGSLSPSILVASMANPFLLIVFSLFCGVTIPKPNIPYFWRVWMYQLDPFTRLISGMVSTELHGLEIQCQDNEYYRFDPPSGQTCQDWAGAFVTAAGGYLQNPNESGTCLYCQYRVGDEFYTPLDISFDTRWRDLGILIAFTVFNALVTLVASRFLRYSKR